MVLKNKIAFCVWKAAYDGKPFLLYSFDVAAVRTASGGTAATRLPVFGFSQVRYSTRILG